MTVMEKLHSAMDICDIHANRLSMALKHMKRLSPLTLEKFETLKDEDFGFLELMSSRFAKLQDIIGRKVFPLLLEVLGKSEERDTFIDILNKLEKLEIIPERSFWDQFRKVRNEIAHEYPDDAEQIISKLQDCFKASYDLLSFWNDLRHTISERTKGA